MDIMIREWTFTDRNKDIFLDGSFVVDSILVPSVEGKQITYTLTSVPPYTKSYSDDLSEGMTEEDYYPYIQNPNKIIYLAFEGDQVVGKIVLKRNWNNFAYVEDLAVDIHYRRYGIGQKLIEQAKRWAKSQQMPGMMLETQNNNVRACKFYEKCGFGIGGFDVCLYKGIEKETDEIALFWYLLFD